MNELVRTAITSLEVAKMVDNVTSLYILYNKNTF